MNAFEFGQMMRKMAVGPFTTTPKPTLGDKPAKPAPQFNFSHARDMLTRHDRSYTPDMTARQVWDRSVELGTIQPGTKKLTGFQQAMKRRYNNQMPATPAFAPPKTQVNALPQQAPPQPQPQPQPPMPQPQQAPPQPQMPLGPHIIRTDNGRLFDARTKSFLDGRPGGFAR